MKVKLELRYKFANTVINDRVQKYDRKEEVGTIHKLRKTCEQIPQFIPSKLKLKMQILLIQKRPIAHGIFQVIKGDEMLKSRIIIC